MKYIFYNNFFKKISLIKDKKHLKILINKAFYLLTKSLCVLILKKLCIFNY